MPYVVHFAGGLRRPPSAVLKTSTHCGHMNHSSRSVSHAVHITRRLLRKEGQAGSTMCWMWRLAPSRALVSAFVSEEKWRVTRVRVLVGRFGRKPNSHPISPHPLPPFSSPIPFLKQTENFSSSFSRIVQKGDVIECP